MSILIISFWSNLAPRSEVRANSSRIVFNVAKDWAATFTSPMICQDIVKTCQGGDNLKQFREQFLSHFQFDQFDQFATLQWFFLEFSIISMQFCAHHCMSLILHVSHLHFPIYPNLPQLSQRVQHGSTFPQRSPMVHMVPPRPTCRRSQPGLHLEFNVSRYLFSLRPTPRWRFNGGQEITGRRKQSFKLWNHSVIGEEFISNKDQIRSS